MTSTPSRPNLPAIAGLVFWIGLLVWFSFWMGQQSFGWLPVQASSAAPLVDGLFSFETAVATFVFAGVVSVMAWVMLFNRAAKYDISDAEPIEGNTKLEIIWTVIPLLLVMGIAYYTIDVNRQIGLIGPMDHVHGDRLASDQQPASGAAVAPQAEIEVIARQWSWEFRYPGAAVSATELHLPLDRRVGLQLRSEDVIHGFYVPAFRLKQQVIPGRSIAFSSHPPGRAATGCGIRNTAAPGSPPTRWMWWSRAKPTTRTGCAGPAACRCSPDSAMPPGSTPCARAARGRRDTPLWFLRRRRW